VNYDGLVKDTHVNACIECGKCTANCPVAQHNPDFSPRLLLSLFLGNNPESVIRDERQWSCLTCGQCRVRCPMDVRYTEFTRAVRNEAHHLNSKPQCAHGGALQSLMKIMTSDKLEQQRMDWIGSDVDVADKGDTLYFVGCSPYFDAFFSDLEIDTLAIARASIRILNRIGITPVVLENERCCGHDLLWAGDVEHYRKLAKENIALIKKIKPERIVFSCAECYRTFKLDYPGIAGDLGIEMKHITEIVMENEPEFKHPVFQDSSDGAVVTYQDPCRLGRHLGVYDAPRQLLSRIPGLEFREMRRKRENAVCCGTNSWINCDRTSRLIQDSRLRMAAETGAARLLTACPKCYIHFTCALKGGSRAEAADDETGKAVNIKVEDLALLLNSAME